MKLKFKLNRKGNYSAGTFLIVAPNKSHGKWVVLNGSARRHVVAKGKTLTAVMAQLEAVAK